MELWRLTKLIRSKNAGPFELTFDIMFKDRAAFDLVRRSAALAPGVVSKLYGVDLSEVRVFEIEEICAIKISIPRRIFSGDPSDMDVYGGQFHAPLVTLTIEGPA
ncbi:MAG: hypothetical protein JWM54_1600 [Acidobacteriaceae bacterium]|jgi:hypothetical protein|nr:hypothetical protein [Acidobacteriaceae bacterium]